MATTHILDIEMPGIVQQLRLMPNSRLRSILCHVLNTTANRLPVVEPEIWLIINDFCHKVEQVSHHRDSVRIFADRADETYFMMQEAGAQRAEWILWFYKARLASALCYCCDNISWREAASAIYELSKTYDDPEEYTRLVCRLVLDAGQ
jgi:hypothetical protein